MLGGSGTSENKNRQISEDPRVRFSGIDGQNNNWSTPNRAGPRSSWDDGYRRRSSSVRYSRISSGARRSTAWRTNDVPTPHRCSSTQDRNTTSSTMNSSHARKSNSYKRQTSYSGGILGRKSTENMMSMHGQLDGRAESLRSRDSQ